MSLKIIKSFPPNIEAIRKKFNILGRNIVFTYGDILYIPSGNTEIPDHLMVHEETHQRQQKEFNGGVEKWWEVYLEAPWFRLEQEVEAYRNQWKFIEDNLNRTERRRLYAIIVKDLSGPIYGNMVSKDEAERLITS
ncbi:hypothetical protein M0R04_06350 [Candidatus Dojkabacteria bacterium]|jgi:hypothetical protein|nr:hypothetical protein [Candidatus Dojkabacteria bacterium]